MKNTISWILWALFTVSLLLVNRNPIYLIIVLISLLVLGFFIAKKQGQPFWLKGNLRFLLSMISISGLINTLFAHTGSTVIFSLPENWLLIGGIITLESLVFGLINGLIIGALYLAFNVLNLALSIKQMTRLIPTTFKPIAMTVTVALTFFPSVQQRAREIKEAQMIRGNPMKRVVDWLPLIIPLLVTSLENAFLLAESMTARGFHIRKKSGSDEIILIGMILGTFAIFSGWILRLYDYPSLISTVLYACGALSFIMIFWRSNHSASTTRYHRESWNIADILVSAFFLLGFIAIIYLQFNSNFTTFRYNPYPSIESPDFHLAGLLMGLVPLLPAVFSNHD